MCGKVLAFQLKTSVISSLSLKRALSGLERERKLTKLSNRLTSLPKGKKRALKFLYGFLLFGVFLASAEMILRIKGFRPWQPGPANILVEPGGRFFKKDPLLGFAHLPGAFKVTLPDGYVFHATHNSDSLRVTHPPHANPAHSDKPEIWIFGCSFTHGWSLNDEETFPWLLQEALPGYEVVNFGVNGFGTLQSFLQFQKALTERKPPRLVILAYMGGHNIRNTLNRSWRKQLAPQRAWGQWDQPYAYLDSKGDLQFTMSNASVFKEFPFMRISALAHFLEIKYDWLEDRTTQGPEISRKIIQKFKELSVPSGIQLTVATLRDDSVTQGMLEYCRKNGIPAGDISVDLTRKENNNLPHDGHPSAWANRQYAAKLQSFLLENSLVDRNSLSRTVSQPGGLSKSFQ